MKPILFNTEMVRALLDGRKTATRRVVKPQPSAVYFDGKVYDDDGLYVIFGYPNGRLEQTGLPYSPDDILYVRETWRIWRAHRYDADAHIEFKAGGEGVVLRFPYGCTDFANRDDYDRFTHKWGVRENKWNPSIHMPREAARIFLRVTDVRVERLQEILTDDCLAPSNIQAEGLTKPCILCIHPDFDCREYIKSGNCDLAREFVKLWDSTIKPAGRDLYGWEANPWVWVIEFKKISKEAADGLDRH